jgi:hypothetical protein
MKLRFKDRIRIYWNDLNATPKMIFSDQSFLTPSSEENPKTVARNFLRENQTLLGFNQRDIGQLKLVDQYTDDHNGVIHLWFTQEYNGIKVFHGHVAFHIDSRGQIALLSFGDVVPDLSPSITPKLSAREAVLRAIQDIAPHSDFEPNLKEALSSREAIFDQSPFGGFLSDEIKVDQQIFPTSDGGRLAWRVLLDVTENPAWYEILVDAETGEILHRYNLVQYSGPQASIFLTNPNDNFQTTVAIPQAWVGASLITGGINVHAGSNPNALPPALPITPAPAFSGTQHWSFPYTGLGNCSFRTDVPAAVTNLFYWNNFMHDYLMNLGFNIGNGNFEQVFIPGFGPDEVIAHAYWGHNFGICNNAFFSTPVDGTSGQMFMLPFNDPPHADTDSDFDNDVLIHEYGHGLSNRLVGGRLDVGCLSNQHGGGMGEGWSDFWAGTINHDCVMGEYVTGDPNNGIRNHNMCANPHDYQDICVHGGGVHALGEIWSATLWHLRDMFIAEYGAGGKALFERLVVDGMQMSTCRPTFLQERDALIMADQLSGGSNYCLIWNGFADFGMGVGAVNKTGCTNSSDASAEVPKGCSGGLASNGILETPTHYALYQNLPNPFYKKTTIRYQIPQSGPVSLKVYDLSGRVVRTLENGDQAAGAYSITWNRKNSTGQEVGSGVYFYRLTAGDFTQTQKMIVLK